MTATDLGGARKLADAILYEGYLLYPYRASSQKNRHRWQFGVLAPRAWAELDGSEPWASQTECLLEPRRGASLHVVLRFLQLEARETADGAWDEGVEHEVELSFPVTELLERERVVPFDLAGGRSGEPPRTRWPLFGVVRCRAQRFEGPYGVVKLRLRVENTNPWRGPAARRDEALRRSLVAAHTLLAVNAGSFVSLLDPPEWARPAAASCDNQHTWPVLVGEEGHDDVLLSSPIILYDHPRVAPESPRDLYDGTEIDEILTLRTMALTDEEKAEARATDARAAAIIDHVDALPPELLERLHGAVRYLSSPGGGQIVPPATTGGNGGHQSVPSLDPGPGSGSVPWWDPGADTSVSPASDGVRVNGVRVARGSKVVLRPGRRRADAQDLFLEGRTATVEAVLLDVDGEHHLAVTLDDDPAADLQRWHGRYLYFAPDEVEPR
jgi:hypothetical protein